MMFSSIKKRKGGRKEGRKGGREEGVGMVKSIDDLFEVIVKI